MVMVTVGTYIAGKFLFKDSFADAGWQWGKVKHYMWIVVLIGALWIAPTLIELAIGTLELPASLTSEQVTWIVIPLFGTLISGFGEEFGWRGYMLLRMAQRMGVRWAVFWHGVIWWSWHLPILAGGGIQAGMAAAEQSGLPVGVSIIIVGGTQVLLGMVPSILHGVVFAYIWTRSRSLAVSTVYHAAYDNVRDSLNLVGCMGVWTGLWATALLSVLGVVFLVRKSSWRGLKEE
jgi:membrane protease YdiL (CAAX protease family)